MKTVVVVAALATAACGTPAPAGPRALFHSGKVAKPAPPPSRQVKVVEFAPSSAAARRYNDRPLPPAPSDPLADPIVEAVRSASVAAGMQAPVADSRLYAAARDLAAIVPEKQPLSYPAIEFALQRHGVVEPSPQLLVIWGKIDDPTTIAKMLVDRMSEIIAAGPFTGIGVGSAPRGDGRGAAILLLATSHIATDPIPRALPTGGRVELHGRVDASYRHPQIFVTRNNGDVDELPVTSAGGEFRAAVACGGRRGPQQVEITADDARGSTTLANFPIWCGQAPPAAIRVEYDPRDAQELTAAQAEQRMLELINADRARYGLPPLEWDPAVAAVARAHSQEMHDTGVVAHISPRTGTATDRIHAAHIISPVVQENVARAYGVVEAEHGLMNSPGHRANILSKLASQIGIGVVSGHEVQGRRELFVTQLFTFQGHPIDLRAATRAVRAKLARVSRAVEDPDLSRLAVLEAREVARGVPVKEANRRTAGRAENVSGRYARVSAAVIPVAWLSAFDAGTVMEPTISSFGLGLAQGPHPQLGKDAIYIVILIAGQHFKSQPRPEPHGR